MSNGCNSVVRNRILVGEMHSGLKTQKYWNDKSVCLQKIVLKTLKIFYRILTFFSLNRRISRFSIKKVEFSFWRTKYCTSVNKNFAAAPCSMYLVFSHIIMVFQRFYFYRFDDVKHLVNSNYFAALGEIDVVVHFTQHSKILKIRVIKTQTQNTHMHLFVIKLPSNFFPFLEHCVNGKINTCILFIT